MPVIEDTPTIFTQSEPPDIARLEDVLKNVNKLITHLEMHEFRLKQNTPFALVVQEALALSKLSLTILYFEETTDTNIYAILKNIVAMMHIAHNVIQYEPIAHDNMLVVCHQELEVYSINKKTNKPNLKPDPHVPQEMPAKYLAQSFPVVHYEFRQALTEIAVLARKILPLCEATFISALAHLQGKNLTMQQLREKHPVLDARLKEFISLANINMDNAFKLQPKIDNDLVPPTTAVYKVKDLNDPPLPQKHLCGNLAFADAVQILKSADKFAVEYSLEMGLSHIESFSNGTIEANLTTWITERAGVASGLWAQFLFKVILSILGANSCPEIKFENYASDTDAVLIRLSSIDSSTHIFSIFRKNTGSGNAYFYRENNIGVFAIKDLRAFIGWFAMLLDKKKIVTAYVSTMVPRTLRNAMEHIGEDKDSPPARKLIFWTVYRKSLTAADLLPIDAEHLSYDLKLLYCFLCLINEDARSNDLILNKLTPLLSTLNANNGLVKLLHVAHAAAYDRLFSNNTRTAKYIFSEYSELQEVLPILSTIKRHAVAEIKNVVAVVNNIDEQLKKFSYVLYAQYKAQLHSLAREYLRTTPNPTEKSKTLMYVKYDQGGMTSVTLSAAAPAPVASKTTKSSVTQRPGT